MNISNCGSITIKKETSPQLGADSPDFPFTASGGTISPTSFNLKDDGSQAYTTLLAGSYTFTEGALPTGWDFDKIECTKTGASTITENETAGARNVVIGLAADDTVVCTFFNNERPQVKVVKTVVGDANARFDLKIDSTVFDNSGGRLRDDDDRERFPVRLDGFALGLRGRAHRHEPRELRQQGRM